MIALIAGTSLAVSAGAETPPVRAADCAASLRWKGNAYSGYGLSPRIPRAGPRLATRAVVPGCSDTLPSADEPDTRIRVRRLRGLAPGLALRSRDAVYIRVGSFPETAAHPLHQALYGDTAPLVGRGGKRCRISGRAEVNPGAYLVVRSRVGPVQVVLDAASRIRARRTSGGVPVLRSGDRITVAARRCPERGRERRVERVTAVRIAPLP